MLPDYNWNSVIMNLNLVDSITSEFVYFPAFKAYFLGLFCDRKLCCYRPISLYVVDTQRRILLKSNNIAFNDFGLALQFPCIPTLGSRVLLIVSMYCTVRETCVASFLLHKV